MAKTLNIDSFNDILFAAFKEQSPKAKAELLIMEIQTAYALKIQHMENVIEALNEGRPYHQELELVNNIDRNLDHMGAQLEELKKAHPEILEAKEGGDQP